MVMNNSIFWDEIPFNQLKVNCRFRENSALSTSARYLLPVRDYIVLFYNLKMELTCFSET
jgi:hypothetical protein